MKKITIPPLPPPPTQVEIESRRQTVSVRPRGGPYAGLELCCNDDGVGLLVVHPDGTERQIVGTAQTPCFRTRRQLVRWVWRRYSQVRLSTTR